jgi:hypothetical protein
MEKREYARLPRHGLSNRYKLEHKAQKAAEILTELHQRDGWRYIVIKFDNMPPTWVILREEWHE